MKRHKSYNLSPMIATSECHRRKVKKKQEEKKEKGKVLLNSR